MSPGDRFRIASRGGSVYEATLLGAGKQDAGLYVRLATGGVARLRPERLDWSTLERSGADALLRQGDEVLFVPRGGVEVRGRLREPLRAQLLVEPPRGHVLSVSPRHVVADTFRLLFRASDLRVGDELLVRSRSGREYRGDLLVVTSERLAVSTRGGEGVSLRVDHLDLTTAQVLIPMSPVARPSRSFALA